MVLFGVNVKESIPQHNAADTMENYKWHRSSTLS